MITILDKDNPIQIDYRQKKSDLKLIEPHDFLQSLSSTGELQVLYKRTAGL